MHGDVQPYTPAARPTTCSDQVSPADLVGVSRHDLLRHPDQYEQRPGTAAGNEGYRPAAWVAGPVQQHGERHPAAPTTVTIGSRPRRSRAVVSFGSVWA